ncbi:MAG: T9SS type A sorting domain-containing protein [Saprospiraceae bacterium]
MIKKLTKLSMVLAVILQFSPRLIAQPTVDGDLSDSDYISLATKQNSNSSFGADMDVTEILYYSDAANSKLYIGVKGKLDVAANNGIGLFLNFTSLSGVPAGVDLGFDGAGHYMDGQGGGIDDNFKADFEVDYMFAMNPGAGTGSVFLDGAKVTNSTNVAEFQGTSNQSGGTATNANVFGTGGAATFAFNNGGGATQGFEIVFDYSALGINSSLELTAGAFIVSATGFFSDVTVPGNITTGNPGFNPDFGNLSGGPYNSSPGPLPVELIDFIAIPNKEQRQVSLNWTTGSETNNSYFEVERSSNARDWQLINKIAGKGNSFIQNAYEAVDNNAFTGSNYYRLKQVDFDGSFEYSDVVQVNLFGQEISVYPNPVNDRLFVETTALGVTDRVELYSAHGVLVKSIAITEDVDRIEMNFSDVPNGLYFLSIKDSSGMLRDYHRILKTQ